MLLHSGTSVRASGFNASPDDLPEFPHALSDDFRPKSGVAQQQAALEVVLVDRLHYRSEHARDNIDQSHRSGDMHRT
jgi:hypothetical protein